MLVPAVHRLTFIREHCLFSRILHRKRRTSVTRRKFDFRQFMQKLYIGNRNSTGKAMVENNWNCTYTVIEMKKKKKKNENDRIGVNL